jgi:membrane-associated phospholipid phosphatase
MSQVIELSASGGQCACRHCHRNVQLHGICLPQCGVVRRAPRASVNSHDLTALLQSAVGGVFLNADAKVTLLLKATLNRARPSSIHQGFSFPSGHSTSVYFTLGFLFLVLVPLIDRALAEDAAGDAGSNSGQDGTQPMQALRGMVQVVAQQRMGAALMVAGGSVTQTGRVLADAHWLSDVAAGALFGCSGVVLSLLVMNALDWRPTR